MKTFNRRRLISLASVPLLTAGLCTVGSSGAPSAAAATQNGHVHVGRDLSKVDQARVTLSRPLPAQSAYNIAEKSTSAEPLEIVFKSGEWTGGIVVSGYSEFSQRLIKNFLENSNAASGSEPIVAIGSSAANLKGSRLAPYVGQETYRGSELIPSQSQPNKRHASSQLIYEPSMVPCEDCDIPVNGGSNNPGVPANGQFSQIRKQGVIESTHHSLRNFSNKGYPATLHVVGLTNGHGGSIKPSYIYEHDYKIKNNGYVSTTDAYDWSSNLPGAYKDTRARGLDGGNTDLDFTVGSVFTWLLDSAKVYSINTDVRAGSGSVISSTARLTASVVPNDGGFSKTDAALHHGCSFTVDPSSYPAAASITPSSTSGDLAWCGGIGDFVHPAYMKNISLISLNPFNIKYDKTCRNWITGAGFTNC